MNVNNHVAFDGKVYIIIVKVIQYNFMTANQCRYSNSGAEETRIKVTLLDTFACIDIVPSSPKILAPWAFLYCILLYSVKSSTLGFFN